MNTEKMSDLVAANKIIQETEQPKRSVLNDISSDPDTNNLSSLSSSSLASVVYSDDWHAPTNDNIRYEYSSGIGTHNHSECTNTLLANHQNKTRDFKLGCLEFLPLKEYKILVSHVTNPLIIWVQFGDSTESLTQLADKIK